MPAPLHSSSVTGAHAHIQVGLASYAGPSTLVFSHLRSHSHIRVGLAINARPSTLVFSVLCSSTHTSWASNHCMPLYTRIQRLVLTHIYELGWQSMPAPLHSYSVTCAHAHIRVGLAINAGPSTLVFSDLSSRTHTSWANNQCRPLYTRSRCLVLTHIYKLG